MNSKSLHKLSVFALVMITVGSVDSIRNLPATALFGSALIFFFLVSAICFLIPCALVSAELSATYAEQGGIYVWVREAFGLPTAYLAIWCQWIENVIWYPTILSFVAGTIAYVISPNLANSKLFLVSVILCTFWGMTLINLGGMKASSWVSIFCSITGLLLPMSLIISLGILWLCQGHPSQLHFSASHFIPNFSHMNLWVSLTGIMMSFCGMEIATVHARDVENPQKSFPRALMISTAIILFTLMFGSLAIAVVLPQSHISLVAGLMQAFSAFFAADHLSWMIPLIGLVLVIGGLGGVNNWIIAPTKGLLVAVQDGKLSPRLRKENRFGSPSALLIIQAIIVTLLTVVFLLLPTVNASYWLLTALASQIYMLMYLLMFAAGIVLRFKHPKRSRPFAVSGGKIGMIVVGGLGILASIITLIVGFIPPGLIQAGSLLHYETLLVAGLIMMLLPPIIIYLWDRMQA